MTHRLFSTDDSRALTLLRLTLALVMLPHGAQKALGWFGGAGPAGTIDVLGQHFGIPATLAVLAVGVEFLAPLALLLGVGTRLAAFALAGQMAVAASFHRANGFFMNWSGTQAGEGFEYHLLYIGAALALVLAGGGAWSLDRALAGRRADVETPAVPRLRRAA